MSWWLHCGFREKILLLTQIYWHIHLRAGCWGALISEDHKGDKHFQRVSPVLAGPHVLR